VKVAKVKMSFHQRAMAEMHAVSGPPESLRSGWICTPLPGRDKPANIGVQPTHTASVGVLAIFEDRQKLEQWRSPI